MESISVFDMLKIGVGPSSSHTLGPWRAANRWIDMLKSKEIFDKVDSVKVQLYGSLSLTGKGHATDKAVMLGLLGTDPVTFDIDSIQKEIDIITSEKTLKLNSEKEIKFHPTEDIVFNRKFLPFHPNGITFVATLKDGTKKSETYYSIGGGFVVQQERKRAKKKIEKFSNFPFPVEKATELLKYCHEEGKSISQIVMHNELSLRSEEEIKTGLKDIWEVMLDSMYVGCHTEGILPGGLRVQRRAFETHKKLIGDTPYQNAYEWIATIRNTEVKFRQILKWVSCFALAVNEVNASLGRVVTAPTNGSAGVIPAVLMYYLVIENHDGNFEDIRKFLMVAGEIGSLFKKGATISAAMGGCQAEIGVSSAMAAGALTELMGGSPDQVLMAAEIAMEHHLGLTCDPIAGLVQIPCIERNAMGAIKAINACEMALDGDPSTAKIPLDKVIATMWETAKDMTTKYKETSEGGLAVQVNISDC
ncbi:MAG: L-serine ammonia-lyase [Flavobacteriaceae bacterium]|nr:L-serine ammonia-lyase [Flavobacteriaceae bacterium]